MATQVNGSHWYYLTFSCPVPEWLIDEYLKNNDLIGIVNFINRDHKGFEEIDEGN